MTPVGQPNVAVEIVAPMVAIVIRSVNVYLTLFLGLVTAGMTTDVLPITDFWSLVVLSAKLSVAGTVVNFVKDLITVFSNLEKRYPLLTGNV
jgi:hypothetical protein